MGRYTRFAFEDVYGRNASLTEEVRCGQTGDSGSGDDDASGIHFGTGVTLKRKSMIFEKQFQEMVRRSVWWVRVKP